MSTVNRKATIIALFLLWLALTGSYMAWWLHPTLLAINFVIWLGLMLWLGFRGPRPGPIHWAMVGVVASILLSAAWNHAWYAGLTQAATWTAYLAIYSLSTAYLTPAITRAARWAFWVFLPLGLIAGFNSNVAAFNVVGLAMLAGGWWPLAAAALACMWLTSFGGLLAIGAAVVVLMPCAWYYRGAIMATAAPLFMLNYNSWLVRQRFLIYAWNEFRLSPIFGYGPGNCNPVGYSADHYFKFWHAHNIIATAAAELGLVGLAALGVFGLLVAKNWQKLPLTAATMLIGFGLWSMVDEPLRFWGPGAMVMIALSRGSYV